MVESPQPAASAATDLDSLVIALPKGRLLDEARASLDRAGYGLLSGDNGRQLVLPCVAPHVRYVLAKPSDVPVYVEYGACDLGIAGLDVLREAQRDLLEPLLLPFGYCRLAVAGPIERADRLLRLEPNPRVATKFPRLTEAFFRQRGVSAEIIELSGSVELAPALGLSDCILDIVQTGGTLVANGLEVIERTADVSLRLIGNPGALQLRWEDLSGVVSALRSFIEKEDKS